ncbi:MAG: tRNA (adenosine(37)-N6)-dimethylallyltransferase MiaA [Calditrichota bacterium]
MNPQPPQIDKPPVLVISGPTAIGKTAVSLAIAKRMPVEILSADSRQIYRYLDIGTAKPTLEERSVAPHHFIDILDPNEDYSAGQYGLDARKVIADIYDRGKVPLLVGGSGLYVKGVLHGFIKNDEKHPKIRETLQQRLEDEGAEALFQELQRVDPESAQKSHPNNAFRTLRALEVYYASGRSISEIRKENRDPAPFQWTNFGLFMDREMLYRRTNRRVKDMLAVGLVEEVKAVMEMGYSSDLNALNSVGYKEVIAYLNGTIDLDKCEELIKRNTRRYAKRQLTWMRADKSLNWVEMTPESDPDEIAESIIATWSSSS